MKDRVKEIKRILRERVLDLQSCFDYYRDSRRFQNILIKEFHKRGYKYCYGQDIALEELEEIKHAAISEFIKMGSICRMKEWR